MMLSCTKFETKEQAKNFQLALLQPTALPYVYVAGQEVEVIGTFANDYALANTEYDIVSDETFLVFGGWLSSLEEFLCLTGEEGEYKDYQTVQKGLVWANEQGI